MKIVRERAKEKNQYGWREPAIGECNHCKTHVFLSSATNDCEKCGTTYNMMGQEYRSDWRDLRDDGMDI
jgi:hypothetical protein